MLLRVITTEDTTPFGALLAPGVGLVHLGGGGQAGLGARLGGRMLDPPYGTVDVGAGCLAAFRLPQGGASHDAILLRRETGEPITLHTSDFDSDLSTIAGRLDRPDKARLLDFLLTFCAPAFKLGRSAAFAAACRRLAVECAETVGTANVLARVLPNHVLVGAMSCDADASAVVIGRRRIVQSRFPVLSGTSGLQIVPRLEPDDLIVTTGTAPAAWTAVAAGDEPHILTWPADHKLPGEVVRAACRRALAGSSNPAAADLLNDMDLMFPAPPRRWIDPAQPVGGEVELAIPDTAGGMFFAGWLRDPLHRVAEISLATRSGRITLAPDALTRVRRVDVERKFAGASHAGAAVDGFLLHLPELPGGAGTQPQLLLRLRSGAEFCLTPPSRSLRPAEARDAVLGCVPAGQLSPTVMQRCLAPAAARLHRAAMAAPRDAVLIRMGATVARPSVSIVVPLYRNLGFLRSQLAALSADPDCRKTELVFVLDSPEQRGEAEHLLRGLHRLTEMPLALAIMPQNLGYAAACNQGALVSTAPLILLLNSDVVPSGPGWLGALRAQFASPAVAAVGPKLLFDDGSIQHAGLYFERDEDGIWFNRHYHKGMPRAWAAADVRRRVPGVTGAALLVRRRAFERAGGVCEDYIIGDYEDSDLCLRLGEAGGAIHYVPKAELFHFERRSIQLHSGYVRTHASLYNRLLHHGRWDAAMAACMSGTTGVAAPRRRA